MSQRFSASALLDFAGSLFKEAGLESERAAIVARILLEADLLGFDTHGFQRLRFNVEELIAKRTRAEGDPVVLRDKQAAFSWDADRLPGPYVVREALLEAKHRAKHYGIGVGTIRRAQHIACLGAYLPEILNDGFAAMICASTPTERVLVSPEGIQPVLSNNPLAFGVPASPVPCFFDISMASVTNGSIARAQRENIQLKDKFLRKRDGELTDDPTVFDDGKGAGVLPMGGENNAHKGFILSLWIELMTSGLNNFGPGDDDGTSEFNSVFVQVFDPDAFGSLDGMKRQVETYSALFSSDPAGATRLPGERSWQRRQDQLEGGVTMAPNIVKDLGALAERFAIPAPQSQ